MMALVKVQIAIELFILENKTRNFFHLFSFPLTISNKKFIGLLKCHRKKAQNPKNVKRLKPATTTTATT
jgi:hypothetical protein